MKHSEIQFKKKVKVIQVYRNLFVYGKEEKSFEKRKEKLAWKAGPSSNGFIKEGELFINQSVLEQKHIEQCQVIILTDEFVHKDSALFKSSVQCLSPAKSWPLYIFTLKNNLELDLKYELFEIGIPQRDNFKLGSLLKNPALEIQINGKIDFSLTAGRARTFMDQKYILEYAGEFKRAFILKPPIEPFIKSFPNDRKLIDLVKTLW